MGKKCWVVGCKTGYLTNKAVEQEQAAKGTPITLHRFPRDDQLRARWLKNIRRDKKDDPSAERHCCSLHFKDSDFKVTTTVRGGRQRKRLVEDAVPAYFSHSAAYSPCMQEAPPAPKMSTSMASSPARRSVQEAERIENEFIDSDKFISLEDLKEKINTEIPRNYRISLDKDAIEKNRQFLTLFTYEPVLGLLPAMANALRIGETGSFVMAKDGVQIANSKLRHILHGHRDVFTRVSQVTKALAFLDNFSVEDTDKVTTMVEAVEDIDAEALCPADVTVEDLNPEKHNPIRFKQESEMPYIKQEAEPETPSIKEEEQEDEIPKFSMIVNVKSEKDEYSSEESGATKPFSDTSFQHLTTKGEERLQPDSLLAPLSDSDDVTSHSSDFNTDEEDFEFDQNASKSLNKNKSSMKREAKECAGGKPFSCSQCDKRFSWKADLEKHKHAHTREKLFVSSTWGKRLAQERTLNRHARTHTVEKPFVCTYCGKSFTKKGELVKHASTHNPEKPFACTFCTACFSQRSNLEKHKRIHTGEKPFVCTLCGKRFAEKGNLNQHTITHTGEKPFACSYCEKRFCRQSVLTRHTLTHTGEKPYPCSVCHKRFFQKVALNCHIKTHTGEKLFACSLCDKRYYTKASLIIHTRTHTKQKPLTCTHCGKKFTQKGHLVIHTRSHTGEKAFNCNV
ncbi:zinc finger protein 260-like [Corythoichthys intestinalis]|uniref:zinc finger protein 260-like n=1 Tax=Corythoichthys intestinalis TaxID=161448 RepID=UPI0025A51C82|nr:zinc finger protein 260-like [Corythoichthys intestinalis]